MEIKKSGYFLFSDKRLQFEGQNTHKCKQNTPFVCDWMGSSVGAGDVSSAVTSTAPSVPSLAANISSRLLSSSEICSTLRFVSAGNRQRKEEERRGGGRRRNNDQTFLKLDNGRFHTSKLLFNNKCQTVVHFTAFNFLSDITITLLNTPALLQPPPSTGQNIKVMKLCHSDLHFCYNSQT